MGLAEPLNNTNVAETVGTLMRRIDDEVARRRANLTVPKPIITGHAVDATVEGGLAALPRAEFAILPPDPVHLKLPTWAGSSANAPLRLKMDAPYHLNDFLPYNDVEFINAAYRAILEREVDEDGMQTYLGMLRDGASKTEILGRLRDSPEGRQRRVHVDGLALPYVIDTLSRWPLIGKLVAIANAVWNLPDAQRSQRRISNDFASRLTQIDRRIEEVTGTVCDALETLEQSQNRLCELSGSFAARSGLEEVQCSIARTAGALESKSDRSDLEKFALEFHADLNAMEQVKANSRDLATLRVKMEGLTESLSAMEVAKANSEDLHSVREESNANLKARMDHVIDLIRGTAQSKADESSLDALSRNSMAAITRANGRWNERVGQIEAGMHRAMDLINGIVLAKADRRSVDAQNRELTGAIEQVRLQMLQALDSKAERQETTALSKYFIGLLQRQPTKAEFERISAALVKIDDVIAGVRQTKADNHDLVLLGNAIQQETRGALDGVICSVDALKRDSMAALERACAQWIERVDQVAAVKVDQIEFREQAESRASLKAEMDRTMDLVNGLVQSKADLGSVDALKRELTAAVEQVRVQLLQTLESKVERQETSALSDHFTGLLQQQPTKEEFERISAALLAMDDVLTGVRQTKADSNDLGLIRNSIETEIRGSLDGVHAVMNSKADQSSILHFREEINGALGEMTHNASALRCELLDELKQSSELLKRETIDRAAADAMRVETKAEIELINIRVENALAPIISRTHELKRIVLDQERRVGLLLEEARKRFPAPISPKQIRAMVLEDEHQLDAMYAGFEDKFRGTRADIRQRLTIYLPHIRDAKAGTSDAPVLDLGCGRGEWLELLHSQGLSAQGVDLNRIFIAGCRELNLDATEQDALSFLQQRKPNSIGVVTSFHLIEHLPHRKLIALIDETLRVLRPGGLVIFETPNPRNLIVAACNFYIDPTHRNPLPPDLSRYLLEARGFCDVDILEIHPFEARFQITEGDKEVKDALNQYLFSAQDYAVIGRKAG